MAFGYLKSFFLFRFLPIVLVFLLRLWGWTLRLKQSGYVQFSPLSDKKENVIYAFWHGRMLMGIFFFRSRGIQVLISLNKDGEIVARVIEKMGFSAIRGSSSRGGTSALRQLQSVLQAGRDVAVTPDGPRGPRYRVDPGIIHLASWTGKKICPLSFSTRKGIYLQSWDRFLIPWPFSRGIFVWGKPLTIRADASKEELEIKCQTLEAELNRITAVADQYFQNG